MGEIDIRVKNFIKLNSVFAQLFSEGVFGGRIRVDPDRLQELDTVNQETVKLEDGQLKDLERLRDAEKISMLFDGRMAFQVIMGVEGQAGVHYYMPVRCMELDALAYSYQCRKISEKAKERRELKKYADGVPKGTKIVPTVTLVLYLGDDPWDGPLSVYDMLDIPEEMKGWAKSIIPDYPMHIIDAKHMSGEEIDRFDGDLRAFLLMIQGNYDEEKIKTAVAIHRETWYALSAVQNDRRYTEYINNVSEKDMAGGVNMDTVLDRAEAKGIDKVNQLVRLLSQDGRIEDIVKSARDKEYQKQLFIEYGLEDK